MNEKIWNLIVIILFSIFLLLPTTAIKQYSETESFTDYREEYKTLQYSSHGVGSEPRTAIYGVTNEDDTGGIFSTSMIGCVNSTICGGRMTTSPVGEGEIEIKKSEYIEAHGYHEFEYILNFERFQGGYRFHGIIAPQILAKIPFTNYREVQRYKTIDIRMYQKIFGLY